MAYLTKLGDAASQFFNVLIFNGDPNYSICGDAWRYKRTGLLWFLDLIFSPLECHHCQKAHLNDVEKARRLLEENGA